MHLWNISEVNSFVRSYLPLSAPWWHLADLCHAKQLYEAIHMMLVDSIHYLPLVTNQFHNHLSHIEADSPLRMTRNIPAGHTYKHQWPKISPMNKFPYFQNVRAPFISQGCTDICSEDNNILLGQYKFYHQKWTSMTFICLPKYSFVLKFSGQLEQHQTDITSITLDYFFTFWSEQHLVQLDLSRNVFDNLFVCATSASNAC